MGWESNNVFQVLIIQGSTGSGLFAYSPSPALGNLVASIAAAGGTDPFGNAYLPGVTSYLPSLVIASSLVAGQVSLLSAPSVAGPWTTGPVISQGGSVMDLTAGGGGHITATSQLLANAGLQVSGGETITAGGLAVTGGITADTEAISSGQAAGLLQTVTNTASGATGSLVRWIVNAAGDVLLGCRVAGDTQNRITATVTAGGLPQFSFGAGGASSPDTFLNRNAAGLFASSPIAFYNAGAAETDQVPTFANSWATAAGRAATTYRRIAIKDTMEWVGSVTVPAGFAANQNMTTANPAAYQPTNNQSIVAIDTTNDNIVRLTYLSTGVLQFSGPAASTAAAHILDIPCQQIRLTD